MKKLFGGAFILLCAPLLSAQTVRFYKLQLDVFEQRGDKVGLADSRTVEVPEGKMRGFMAANFTLDLTAQAKKKTADLSFHLTTLGPEVASRDGRALLDSGQVLAVPGIPGKGGSRYELKITYQGSIPKKTACSHEDFTWNNDPSPHFYFWFVRNTWGDFHWNLLRDRVEDRTDSLTRLFHLSTSQKLDYYFAPCPLSDWLWDGRFYFSLEPARRRAVSVYGREANSFSPWVPNLLLFYVAWGHAPAPLAEGAAAYFDYPHYFAQQYLKEGKLDSVSRFLTTYRYRRLPPERALMEAASFVRFLSERYSPGLFEKLYRSATDLTLRQDLARLFGKPVDSLEAEWRRHLSDFQPEPGTLRALAQEDFWNYRFLDALELYRRALALDPSPGPADYEDCATQFYNLGEYDSALFFYQKAMDADSGSWRLPYVVANFYQLLDDSARARERYRRILDIDSSVADGLVRQGTHCFESGQFARAESLYREALRKKIRPEDLAELNLNLGYITQRLKKDPKKGNELLNTAWGFYRQARAAAPGLPYPYWRLGELFMYKNFPDSAEASLKFALYLETRPYYLGKILVRLGNLYDLLGRRREAEESYREVLNLAAAPLEHRRARAYLQKPFSIPLD